MKNHESTRGESITELTEGTEGDNELEGQRRKRWTPLPLSPGSHSVPSEPSVKRRQGIRSPLYAYEDG